MLTKLAFIGKRDVQKIFHVCIKVGSFFVDDTEGIALQKVKKGINFLVNTLLFYHIFLFLCFSFVKLFVLVLVYFP